MTAGPVPGDPVPTWTIRNVFDASRVGMVTSADGVGEIAAALARVSGLDNYPVTTDALARHMVSGGPLDAHAQGLAEYLGVVVEATAQR